MPVNNNITHIITMLSKLQFQTVTIMLIEHVGQQHTMNFAAWVTFDIHTNAANALPTILTYPCYREQPKVRYEHFAIFEEDVLRFQIFVKDAAGMQIAHSLLTGIYVWHINKICVHRKLLSSLSITQILVVCNEIPVRSEKQR